MICTRIPPLPEWAQPGCTVLYNTRPVVVHAAVFFRRGARGVPHLVVGRRPQTDGESYSGEWVVYWDDGNSRYPLRQLGRP